MCPQSQRRSRGGWRCVFEAHGPGLGILVTMMVCRPVTLYTRNDPGPAPSALHLGMGCVVSKPVKKMLLGASCLGGENRTSQVQGCVQGHRAGKWQCRELAVGGTPAELSFYAHTGRSIGQVLGLPFNRAVFYCACIHSAVTEWEGSLRSSCFIRQPVRLDSVGGPDINYSAYCICKYWCPKYSTGTRMWQPHRRQSGEGTR